METPKYLYHYTKLESALSILNSGQLRLYNVKQQSDPFEVIYAGETACDKIFSITKNRNSYYSDKQKSLLMALLILLPEIFSIDKYKEFVKKLVNSFNEVNTYSQLYEISKNRIIKLFISCFANSFTNKYLWENYTNQYYGGVLKLKIDYLPNNIGIKKVIYGKENFIKNMLDIIFPFYKSSSINEMDFMKSILESITHICLSFKKEEYSLEEEYRLILEFDSGRSVKPDIIVDGNREYVNLPLTKPQFLKRIHEIIIIRDALSIKDESLLQNKCNELGIKLKRIRKEELK